MQKVLAPVIQVTKLKHFEQLQLTKYFLFLVWPFAAFLLSVVDYRSAISRNIIWLFCGFIGYTAVIAGEGMDMNFYKEEFYLHQQTDDNLFEFIAGVYEGEHGRGDYYDPVLSYIVGNFTNDYRVLFACYALVFGYFWLKNIWFVLDRIPKGTSFWFFPLFIAAMVLASPIWDFAIRFYVAGHIYIYGVFLYCVTKRKSGIWLILSTFLVHLSFVLPIGIFFLFLITGTKRWLYLVFLVVGLAMSNLDLATVFANLPEELMTESMKRGQAYTADEYLIERLANVAEGRWFLVAKEKGILYASLTILSILGFAIGRKVHSLGLDLLTLFGLLFMSLIFVVSMIPDVDRFYRIATFISIAALLLYSSNSMKVSKIRLLFAVLALPLLLHVVVELRRGVEIIGAKAFVSNVLFSGVTENKTPVLKILSPE